VEIRSAKGWEEDSELGGLGAEKEKKKISINSRRWGKPLSIER